MSTTKSIQLILFITAIIFVIFILMERGTRIEYIDHTFITLELIIGLLCYGGIFLSTRIINAHQLYLTIFILSFVISIICRISFLLIYNLPYGLAVDSYTYDSIVIPNLTSNYTKLFRSIIDFGGYDDLGYPSILYLIYNITDGEHFGRLVILMINSLFLGMSAYAIFELSKIIGFTNRESGICSALYGFNPFLYITAAVGLKEVIFGFLIINSLLFMYRWKHAHTITNFIFAWLFIISTFFFRSAICLMLIIIYFTLAISTANNKRFVLWCIILGGIIAPIIGDYVLQSFTGLSFEHILAVTEARNNSMNSTISGPFIQILASLLGPFPSFFRMVQYALLFSSGVLLKCIFNILYMIGCYFVIKNLNYKLYPIFLFTIFGLALLVIGGVALDMRYVVTFLSPFIIISFYGLKAMHSLKILYFYIPLILIIIYNYNVR